MPKFTKNNSIGSYSHSKLIKVIQENAPTALTVQELDGSPIGTEVNKIVFPNTAVTLSDSDKTATIDTALTVQELDGSPAGTSVNKIVFPNATITLSDSDKTATISLASLGGGSMSQFFLEDGDGTEVTISNSKEVKFVEGGGVDINWTDISDGSDSDPYDLTFAINLGDISAVTAATDDYVLISDSSDSNNTKKALVSSMPGTITALNNQAESRLLTIGSTTTELDGEANLTYNGTTFTVGGIVDITDTTDASDDSGDTGALRCEGGASIAKKLYVGTDLDVDGTANLDGVDIDGAVQIDNTLTVGVNGTGYDVKFFGTTSGQYMLWDEGSDELVLVGDTKLSFHDAAGGENIIASADGHLEINAGTTLDVTVPTVELNATLLHVKATDPRIRAEATADNHPGFELSEAGTRKWVIYNQPDGGADNLTFKSTADRFEITPAGNLHVMADSSVINMGAGDDVTFTHDGTTGLTIAATPISIDSTGELHLNSTTGDIKLQDGGTDQIWFDLDGTSGAVIIKPMVDGDDLVFQQYDRTEVMRIEDDATVSIVSAIRPDADDGATLGSANLNWSDLYLADGAVINLGDDQDVTLTHIADTGIQINTSKELQFRDSALKIYSSTNGQLDIDADTELEIATATVDIGATTAFNLTTPTVLIDSTTSQKPVVEVRNVTNDAYGPTFQFTKSRGVDAVDNDVIGNILFQSYDDGTPSTHNYAKVIGSIADASNSTEDGKMQFQISKAGTVKDILVLDECGATVYDGLTVITDYNTTTFESQLSDGGSCRGEVIKYEPGGTTTLTLGRLYFLCTDGTWDETDADNTSNGSKHLLGIALGTSATTHGVLLKGFIKIPSTEVLNLPGSGATDGLPLYISTTPGHFDFNAASATGDFVRVVGYCIDDDSSDILLYFNPDPTWVEIR